MPSTGRHVRVAEIGRLGAPRRLGGRRSASQRRLLQRRAAGAVAARDPGLEARLRVIAAGACPSAPVCASRAPPVYQELPYRRTRRADGHVRGVGRADLHQGERGRRRHGVQLRRGRRSRRNGVARAGEVEPASIVAVVGCGPLGLSAVQGARIAGASTIIAIDPIKVRRDAGDEGGRDPRARSRTSKATGSSRASARWRPGPPNGCGPADAIPRAVVRVPARTS